jgi:uncharacterized cupin superfamily protein
MPACDLKTTYLRLRPDSSIEPIPAEGFWPRLMSGQLGDFHNEYLVTTAEYEADWPAWEVHPNGEEIVCLISGHVTLTQEKDGATSRVELTRPGDFALNPRGTWHTADVHEKSVMLFITAGEGTTNRPRS